MRINKHLDTVSLDDRAIQEALALYIANKTGRAAVGRIRFTAHQQIDGSVTVHAVADLLDLSGDEK